MNINRERIFDLSLGTQNATNTFLRKPNEVEDSRNILWNEEIGSAVGRPGYITQGDDVSVGKVPINAHTANFREGAVRMVAVNNSSDTFTLVRSQNPDTGAWTTLISDLPVDSKVFFKDYLNEVYVSGYSPAGVPFQPRNINAALNVSTTRNLLNCPYPYYFVEYLGIMYAANVMIGATRYANRVYKSSAPTGAFTFIRGAQTGTLTSLAVDSVRYLKAGMAVDIYAKGTSTKLYDITITGVDKTANTISFTSTSITVADNDEVFFDGRYGTLTIGWNTDYPTEDRSDYLEIQPGPASSDDITGIGKSSGRLFIFTENTSTRWDGQNLVTFNTNVGCINHRTIANIDDDWLIWMDKKARVWARNEAAGDQQFISRGVHNRLFSNFTAQNMRDDAHAIVYNNKYKIWLGTLGGENLRATYDFDSNTFSPERLHHNMTAVCIDEHEGDVRLYMFDDTGSGFIDELGDDDDGNSIAFMIQLGRKNMGTEGLKKWYGIFIYSEYAAGLKVLASLGKGQMKPMGSINKEEELIVFPKNMEESTTMNLRISGRYRGPAPLIEGIVLYFVNKEDIPQNG